MKKYIKPTTKIIEINYERVALTIGSPYTDIDTDNPLREDERFDF